MKGGFFVNNFYKKIVSLIICITMMLTFTVSVFADNDNSVRRIFKDVNQNHWAYEYIMWLFERNIIEGVGNGYFDPNGTVTRAQFAKMMVLTLKLDLYSPDTPSFLDVKKSNWEYAYVESAKPYLTGFRTANGDYYRPSQPAVREDMAVALVKAMGYQNDTVDESILNRFADANKISPNLRRYVALSVKHGLIEGKTGGGQPLFDPQGNLTRAEAATLLYRAFKKNEEKVTYDEDKVTYDDDKYIAPSVSVSTENNSLVVRWNRINSSKLTAYCVVISQYDSTPQYPDNGFLYYITDKNQTSAVIDNRVPYNGNSDFGSYLEKGKEYYISVTAVYTDKYVAGNTVRKKYPGANTPDSYPAPEVRISNENGIPVLRWNRIDSNDFKEYMIVISKNNSSPRYPQDGYLYRIIDRNKTYAIINNSDKYNGGDFGNYLNKGEYYYFSVTAIYKDKIVAGNAVHFQYNGAENPEAYVMPIANASEENGKLILRWNKIDSPKLLGYRVVISKDDSLPTWPDNGYLYWITDRNRNYAVIDNTTPYTGGDFGSYLVKGEKYFFNVTAVYTDRIITGNVIQYTYNGEDHPSLFPALVMNIEENDEGKLVIKWNKIDSPELLEYRLVISQYDQTPVYPENGFYKGAFDKETTSVTIDSVNYNGGDFSTLTHGTEYYFSITAVYRNNKYIAGNVIKRFYFTPAGQ